MASIDTRNQVAATGAAATGRVAERTEPPNKGGVDGGAATIDTADRVVAGRRSSRASRARSAAPRAAALDNTGMQAQAPTPARQAPPGVISVMDDAFTPPRITRADREKARAALLNCEGGYTAVHMAMVERYLNDFTKALDGTPRALSPERQDDLRRAAAVYDGLKAVIPNSIWDNPGKPSPEDWQQMCRHTHVSTEASRAAGKPVDPEMEKMFVAVAGASGNKDSVREIVRHHHEKLDGTAYPDGLKGEQISQEAQMVGIADMFDSLTNPRSFRPAKSYDDAAAILKGDADKGKLDPELVSTFLSKVVPNDAALQSRLAERTRLADTIKGATTPKSAARASSAAPSRDPDGAAAPKRGAGAAGNAAPAAARRSRPAAATADGAAASDAPAPAGDAPPAEKPPLDKDQQAFIDERIAAVMPANPPPQFVDSLKMLLEKFVRQEASQKDVDQINGMLAAAQNVITQQEEAKKKQSAPPDANAAGAAGNPAQPQSPSSTGSQQGPSSAPGATNGPTFHPSGGPSHAGAGPHWGGPQGPGWGPQGWGSQPQGWGPQGWGGQPSWGSQPQGWGPQGWGGQPGWGSQPQGWGPQGWGGQPGWGSQPQGWGPQGWGGQPGWGSQPQGWGPQGWGAGGYNPFNPQSWGAPPFGMPGSGNLYGASPMSTWGNVGGVPMDPYMMMMRSQAMAMASRCLMSSFAGAMCAPWMVGMSAMWPGMWGMPFRCW